MTGGAARRMVYFGLALGAGCAAAQAQPACVPGAAPKVQVLRNFPTVMLDNNVDGPGLEALRRKYGGKEVKAGYRLQGFTATRFKREVNLSAQVWRLKDGTWCASLKEATITLEFEDPMRVYVKSDFRPGTCAYDVVYAHEMQHVQFGFDALERHLGPLRDGFAASLRPLTAVRGNTEEQAGQYLKQALADVVKAAADNIQREADEMHDHIDSDENYRAESRKCRDW